MHFENRKSGLEPIAVLRWGSHFCQFYRDSSELCEILLPYLRAGLENNELCVVVTGEGSCAPRGEEQAASPTPCPPPARGGGDDVDAGCLVKNSADLQPYLDSGQLVLVPNSRWLALRERSGNAMMALLDGSVFRGFDGVRLACVLAAQEGEESLTQAEMDEITRNNVLAMFAFPRDQFDAPQLMELVKKHRFALLNNGRKWELIESYEAQIVRDELKRSEEKVRFLFSNMSAGFAYHRIVLDGAGSPVDYIFLELNQAFLRLTGLSEQILGRRVKEVLPGITGDATDWVAVYGKVALTGEPTEFESYSEAVGRWFDVCAFSPQKGYFAVTISDITQRKAAEREIRKLNEELKDNLAELYVVNSSLRDSRRAALNLMEDAVAARREAEEATAQLRRGNARLNILADTTSDLLKSGSPQDIVDSLCQRVLSFLDCQVFFNFLVDEEAGRLHLNACAGIPEDERRRIEWLDFGVAICGCAARDACRIVAEDIQNGGDPHADLVRSYGIQAYACHPLMVQGRIHGTLSFGTSNRTSFNDDELAMMKAVADQVSIAMERQRMEESVRQSQAMLEAFFDASPGILNIQDEEFRFVKTDRFTPTYFGLDREGILGRGVGELAPEIMREHGAMMRHVLESGEPELNAELCFSSRSDKDKSYWLASYFPVPLARGRRGLGIMGVDITGKKRAEEALLKAHDELEQRVRERTEELRYTVDTLRREIADRKTAEEKLHRLNRLHAVLSEIDQAIIRATDRDSLFHDFCRIATEQGEFLLAWVGIVDGEGRVNPVAASGATGYLEGIEVTAGGGGPIGISLREGTYYICNDFQNDPRTPPWPDKVKKYSINSCASIAIKEEGSVIGALTLYGEQRDVFDRAHEALLRQMGADISFALDNLAREERRRKAEQALQQETLERLRAVEDLREKERLLIQQSRQAAMGEMIGNIAHQWRQPLNTLGLMVQELSMCYEMGQFSQQYLEQTVGGVMRIVSHMSHTIDDFRNFFRPEKEKVSFRVGQVIQNAITMMDASLKEHRITLEVQSAADPQVLGYPNEYMQVLLNILLNARDALNDRDIADRRIEVQLTEEQGRAVVTIADNAGGIAPEVLEKIFDPYFTTKGPDKGTGVGLYMSKSIIEKNMNGRLTAHNRDNGAHFRIEV